MTPVTRRQYSAPMILTSREEKVRVRKVPNPLLSRQRVQHLEATLQWSTQVRNSPTFLQVKEEIKKPPSIKIENSHKLPLRKKRKNIVQEEEGPWGESDIHDLSLEDMELKIDIEKVFPNIDHLENTDHQNPRMEIIETETFDEQESFAFQSIVFNGNSKKLIIEKRDVTNKKGKSRSEINLRKSAQSTTITPKSTTSRSNTTMVYPSKKFTHISSGEGGDKKASFHQN
jgi:hypothetical protein